MTGSLDKKLVDELGDGHRGYFQINCVAVNAPIAAQSDSCSQDVEKAGKIVVDKDTGRFELQCYGLKNHAKYTLIWLRYGEAGEGFPRVWVTSGVTNNEGILHVTGYLDRNMVNLLCSGGSLDLVAND